VFVRLYWHDIRESVLHEWRRSPLIFQLVLSYKQHYLSLCVSVLHELKKTCVSKLIHTQIMAFIFDECTAICHGLDDSHVALRECQLLFVLHLVIKERGNNFEWKEKKIIGNRGIFFSWEDEREHTHACVHAWYGVCGGGVRIKERERTRSSVRMRVCVCACRCVRTCKMCF